MIAASRDTKGGAVLEFAGARYQSTSQIQFLPASHFENAVHQGIKKGGAMGGAMLGL